MNILRRWLSRRPPPNKRQYNESTVGLEDWQKNEKLSSMAADVLADPRVIQMIAVLRSESPANYGLPQLGVSADDRVAFQARTEGYHLCLNNLEALGKLTIVVPESEPTYEPPEDETSRLEE